MRFLKNRSGAALIECTLIGALMTIAVISGLALFAGNPVAAHNQPTAQIEFLSQR
ncbi:putative cytosolic protein [Brucella melitensis NI]|nr:putative cytosolic protein [Brucella melitensis NI]